MKRLQAKGLLTAVVAISVWLEAFVTECSPACDIADLSSLSPPIPAYFDLDTATAWTSGSFTSVRCTNGRYLSPSVDSDGFLKVECNDTAAKWIVPASSWPAESDCTTGDKCNVTVVANALPTHLKSLAAGDEVDSGAKLAIGCSDVTKALVLDLLPMEYACFHGTFEGLPQASGWPAEDMCFEASSCSEEAISLMASVPYLERVGGGMVLHGDDINYRCSNGKVLDDLSLDPDQDGIFSMRCEDGNAESGFTLPSVSKCKAKCTNVLTLPGAAGFTDPGTVSVLQGDYLELSCADASHHVSADSWSKKTLSLECFATGAFIEPADWPTCGTRPECPPATNLPLAAKLKLKNDTINVPASEFAIFECEDDTKVTTNGKTVQVQCRQDNLTVPAAYSYPVDWGGADWQCRAPNACSNPPTPPVNSGLKLKEEEGVTDGQSEYLEFSSALYVCEDSAQVMYLGSVKTGLSEHQVPCIPPGVFATSLQVPWPECDVAERPRCEDPATSITLPNNVNISLVSANAVPQGGAAYFKCDDEDEVTSLGSLAEVPCVKDYTTKTVSFQIPAGWTLLSCEPAQYPNFKVSGPRCHCLGDQRVIESGKSLEILKKVCIHRDFAAASSKTVPFKHRCGVTNLEEIIEDNYCRCLESDDSKFANFPATDRKGRGNGVDFGIWANIELTNYKFMNNYTEPGTEEFKKLQIELEYELDRLILNKHPSPDAWRYVRSRAFAFVPGRPMSCSEDVIPLPDEASGLELVESKTTAFGEEIEYRCKNPDHVTNDGFTYKRKCLENGQYNLRDWLPCRERRVCAKPPPRPSEISGLAFSHSSLVLELDEAVYECKNSTYYYVPNSMDGKFRTPCKKIGEFHQSKLIAWPTCVARPEPGTACDIPTLPEDSEVERLGYEQSTVPLGGKITYQCKDTSLLLGDSETLSYTCGPDGNFIGYSSLPQCRMRDECDPELLPLPSVTSGLMVPFQTQMIQEGEYVEYDCENGSPFALYGEYSSSEFQGDDLTVIAGGKLRVSCGPKGVLGQVTVWPECRNSSVTHCTTFPDLSEYELIAANPGQPPVAIGDEYMIKCFHDTFITENFKTIGLKCGWEGEFLPPAVPYTKCRLAKSCAGVFPDAPAEMNTNLIKFNDAFNPPPAQEKDVQKYVCDTGYTLSGKEHELINDAGQVEIPCEVASDGAIILPSNWPQCVEIASECTELPDFLGFVRLSEDPVPLGGTLEYRCIDSNQVTTVGATLMLTCTESGSFTTPPEGIECRAPVICPTPPAPDQAVTRLLESTTATVREFGFAEFACQPGTDFEAGEPNVVNGLWQLECHLGGAYDPVPAWPTCKITHCLTVDPMAGLELLTSGPVAVDDFAEYSCEYQGQIVNETDQPLKVRCQDDGTMLYPDPVPGCRSREFCNAEIPYPTAASFLLNSTSSGLREFDYATFSCKDGGTLQGVSGFKVENDKFMLQCPVGGEWPTMNAADWPTCIIEFCTVFPDYPTNLKAISTTTVPVSSTKTYHCTALNHVLSSGGHTYEVPCGPDGTMQPVGALPTCVLASECPAAPTPDAGSGLTLKDASPVFEYSAAVYACPPGSGLNDPGNANIIGGEFHVACESGATWETVTWPTCEIQSCVDYPTTLGADKEAVDAAKPAVPINEYAHYKCSTPSHIMDTPTGFTLDLLCDPATGQFQLPASEPDCRAPEACPLPPDGAALDPYHLERVTVGGIKEFSYIEYKCGDGTSFAGVTNPGIVGDKFRILCEQRADASTPPVYESYTLPTCSVSFCTAVPDVTGFVAQTTPPVSVGGLAQYQCSDETQVIPDAAYMELTCDGSTGQFTVPDPLPVCQSPQVCSGAPPTPSAESGLQNSASSDVDEFSEAVYECQTGSTLYGSEAQAGVRDGKFHLLCKQGGSYDDPASITWPTCKFPKCDTIPDETGFVTTNAAPIWEGSVVVYACQDGAQVTDDGAVYEATCLVTGEFQMPTFGTCRDAVACPALPDAPGATGLQKPATPPYEFESAVYTCPDGKHIENSAEETSYSLECLNGAAYETPSWPNCVADACTVSPIAGFVADKSTAAFGEVVTFTCAVGTQVTDQGYSWTATCQADGTLDSPPAASSCRAPTGCSAPPIPAVSKNLQPTTSVISYEFDVAVFECMDGFYLPGGVNFEAACPLGGDWSSEAYPTCMPKCMVHLLPPTASGLLPKQSGADSYSGDEVTFECADPDATPDDSGSVTVTCGTDGNFIEPAAWANCRPKAKCPFAPVPPASSNFEVVSTLPVAEGDNLVYRCKSGFKWTIPGAGDPQWPGMDQVSGEYRLRCMSDGFAEAYKYWSTQGWPTCDPVSKRRRRRWLNFPNLMQDIDYTVRAYFEAQFMWTDAIEADVYAATNVTRKMQNFTLEMIFAFLDDMETIIGDGNVKAGLVMNPFIQPVCDQPTGAMPSLYDCMPLPNTPAVCSREIVKGAWLESLGYTYQIQEALAWLYPIGSSVGPFLADSEADIPIGSAVNFYCMDDLKRPRVDEWDSDSSDGVISGYCTHGGILSISMTPADWDKCRMRCPSMKPVPPSVTNAQLVSYDTEQKNERKLWEDEEISYGCENTSLVLDGNKGMVSVSYKCLDTGKYDAPDGDVFEWPKCTGRPIDDLIISAISLITNRYDTNLVYRQKLTKGDVKSDVEFLSTTEGVMSITIPAIGAIFAFCFCVMCCSRANSPICKIFEPQS